MFLPLVVAAGLGLVLVAFAGLLAGTGRPRAGSTPDSAVLVAARRHAARWRGIGAVTAIAVPLALVLSPVRLSWPVGSTSGLGRGPALLPSLAAALLLTCVVVRELTAPTPRSVQRAADLRTRRVRDVVPAGWAWLVGGGGVALVVTLAVGVSLGSADDLGRPGRALLARCTGATAGQTSTVGPWPGSFYALPLALASLGGVLLAWWALRVVVRRPRPDLLSAEQDADVRRESGRQVALGLGVLLLGTVAPVAAVAAAGLGRNDCGPSWWGWSAAGFGGVALLGSAATAVCLAALLRGPVVGRQERCAARPGR